MKPRISLWKSPLHFLKTTIEIIYVMQRVAWRQNVYVFWDSYAKDNRSMIITLANTKLHSLYSNIKHFSLNSFFCKAVNSGRYSFCWKWSSYTSIYNDACTCIVPLDRTYSSYWQRTERITLMVFLAELQFMSRPFPGTVQPVCFKKYCSVRSESISQTLKFHLSTDPCGPHCCSNTLVCYSTKLCFRKIRPCSFARKFSGGLAARRRFITQQHFSHINLQLAPLVRFCIPHFVDIFASANELFRNY